MGQAAAWGIPGERGCLRPERAPVKIRRPGPRGSMASPSSFQVPGAMHPGSGSPQVNAFADTKGKSPPRPSQIGGLELWETPVAGHSPLSRR